MAVLKKITAAMMILALTACSEQANESVSTAPVTESQPVVPAQETKDLVAVGVDTTYPPYGFLDEQGNPTGFDVDVLKAIGQKQGVKFLFMPATWDGLQSGLDNGRYAVGIAGFARTSEREEKYQVSNTYGYGQDAIVMLEGTVGIDKYTDLKNYKVLTLADSPYIPQLEELMGKDNPNLIGEKNTFLTIKNLVAKHADATFADKGVIQYYAKSFPDIKFKIVDTGSEEFEPYELVMLANKNEAELMSKINAGLTEIVVDGTYATIHRKWFGSEPPILPAGKQ